MVVYLQIVEECTLLLSISTHHGLFKFKWLSFGAKVAPAIFQQVIDEMVNDYDFTIAYLDGVLIKKGSLE